MDQNVFIENLITQAFQQKAGESQKAASSCPDDSLLAAYLSHTLKGPQKEKMQDHLSGCADCRSVAVCAYQSNSMPAVDDITPETYTALIKSEHQNNKADPSQSLAADIAKWEAKLNLAHQPKAGTHRPGIMIVDDDHDYLAAICECLEGQYQITACTSGSEALKKIDDSIELIILDIKMPGMDGFHVAEALIQGSCQANIIFNTAYPGEIVKGQVDSPYRTFSFYTKDDADGLLSGIHTALL